MGEYKISRSRVTFNDVSESTFFRLDLERPMRARNFPRLLSQKYFASAIATNFGQVIFTFSIDRGEAIGKVVREWILFTWIRVKLIVSIAYTYALS